MIVHPNAKINLGLNVLEKRSDGFHSIETVFYPIGMRDALEIIVSPDHRFSFTSSGRNIPGDPESNLCVRAWKDFSAIYCLPPVKIHLHKVIPMGSGLGGGSSDGAFTITLLDSLFSLNLSKETMIGHARKLGSDCAFFCINKPVFATGKGDKFNPISLCLPDYKILVVVPGINMNTAAAYGMITPQIPGNHIQDLVSQPMINWENTLKNDFEIPVFRQFPQISKLKERLYKIGAVYASMSGSGVAVYGIFPRGLPVSMVFKDCFVWLEA